MSLLCMWNVSSTICPPAVVPVLGAPLVVALLPWLGGALVALSRPATLWNLLRIAWRVKISLVVLAGVVTAAVVLGPRVFASAGSIAADENTKTDWPMFRGGARRTGAVAGTAPPLDGGLNWAFKDEKTFYSTPTVVGKRVYATSIDYGPITDRGMIFCLDAETGKTVWKCRPGGYRATFSSPAVSGKYLVVGEGLHKTRDSRIFCLDLTQEGKVLWALRTNSHVESSPCIDGGRVYVGAGDDGYYCIELEPDAAGKPGVAWHAPTEEFRDAETSPALADGRVFVGLGMDGKAVCCLDAATGRQLWRQPASYPVFTAPTVVGGKVYVGMGNGNFIEEAETVMANEVARLRKAGKSDAEIEEARKSLGPAGEVWCLDAATGRIEWKQKFGRAILGAIAAGRDRVFFGCRDGFIYSYSLDGKPRGKWDGHAPIVTSPAIADQYVYFVTETGRLYALDVGTMELAWETTVGTKGPFLSSPTVARGHVYVGSSEEGLLCLGQPRTEVRRPLWPGHLGGPGKAGSPGGMPLPGERGALAWRYPYAPATTQPTALITAPVAAMGDYLYIPLAGGERKGLVCLKNDAKVTSSRQVRELWFVATDNGVKLSPAATEDAAFIVDGGKGDRGRYLRCLNPASNGAVRWRTPVAAEASGEFSITGDAVVIQDGADMLSCLDLNGSVRWTRPIGKVRGTVAACGSMLLAAIEQATGEATPTMMALDRETGTRLWQASLPSAPQTGPAVRKNVAYIGTAEGMIAVSVIDGSVLWRSRSGGVTGGFALLSDQIAYVTSTGDLALVDLATGGLRAKTPGFVPGFPPLPGRDELLLVAEGGLVLYSLDSGRMQQWMNLADWSWSVTAPMVLLDGRVLFGTDRGGVVCLVKGNTGG